MLFRLLGGVFLVLHGLVHLWYVVLSQGWVEVEPQMGWGGHSWLLSPFLASETVLALASLLYVVVTAGFVIGGLGYALRQDWWAVAVVAAAVLSTLVIVTMWDGRFEMLVEKGAAGVLVNLGLVVYLLAFE